MKLFFKIFFLSTSIFVGLSAVSAVLAFSDSAAVQASLEVIAESSSSNSSSSSSIVAGGGNGGGGAGQLNLIIGNIGVKTNAGSAIISWQTSLNSACRLYWGQTSQYEKKIIAETVSNSSHSTALDNLEMQLAYHFKISCSTERESVSSQDYTFILPQTLYNISNFKAIPGDQKIILNWTNPANPGFQGVALVRNENSYPQNKDDGILVYQGYGNSFIDKNLINGKTYYYSLFTVDKNKNYVLTAFASATPFKEKAPAGEIIPQNPATPSASIQACPPIISSINFILIIILLVLIILLLIFLLLKKRKKKGNK